MEQQHAIGKFSLEVQLPSRQDVFSLQSRLSSRCTIELAPLLAELLDSWTAPGELLQIDRLEIDLGSCTLEMLERELPQLIIAFLRKRYPAMQQQTMLEPGMERVSLGQGFFESWLYFLEFGVLPPFAVKWSREEWEAGVLETLATESSAYQRSYSLLSDNTVAVKRLLLQFSAEFVQNFVLAYSGSAYQPLLTLISEWEAFCYHPQLSKKAILLPVLPVRADFHLVVMEWLIKEIVLKGKQMELFVVLKQVIELQTFPAKYWLFILQQQPADIKNNVPLLHTTALKLSEEYAEALTAIDEEIGLKAARNTVKEIVKITESTAPASSSSSSEKQDKTVTSPSIEASNTAAAVGSGTPAVASATFADSAASPSATTSDKFKSEDADIIAEGTALYINNAGLILLHPYIGILFEALDLRDETGLKDPDKAVQLLGYLACGQDDIPEYDLVFPKLLCGIVPSTPVKRFVPLTDTDKKEADELLSAVIAHWSALGNTTPDGLRGNFLMREGKLEWKEEEWQLYVTQQPYDMLLNRLPWGFSVVGLSWMPWLIKTVWT